MADKIQDQDEHPATEMSTLLNEMLENLTTKVDQVGEEINAKRVYNCILSIRRPELMFYSG